VKIIRTVAACALAGSALVGSGLGVAAVTASAAPAAVVADSGALPICPAGTLWEAGACVAN
jgi:hypothetical protein